MEEQAGKKISKTSPEEQEYAHKLLKAAASSGSFRELNSKIVQLSKENQDEEDKITNLLLNKNEDQNEENPSSSNGQFSSVTEMLWLNSRKNPPKKKVVEEITVMPSTAPIEEIIDDHIKLKKK